jgi:hypothetical protein
LQRQLLDDQKKTNRQVAKKRQERENSISILAFFWRLGGSKSGGAEQDDR